MTDFSNDELASAYLDGEATADERAQVEGDPALMALVEHLRGVSGALADAPIEMPSAATQDAAVRAAVRSSTIVDLRAERARRRLRTASIAAAIIAVIGGLGILVTSIGSSSDRKLSASASNSSSAAAPALGQTTGAEAFDAAASAPLGTFADDAHLADAARVALSSVTTTAPAPALAAGQADSTKRATCSTTPSGATEQLLSTTAVLQGTNVQVEVFAIADGSRLLVVTDAATCTELFSQPL